jgi:hypothetical protein
MTGSEPTPAARTASVPGASPEAPGATEAYVEALVRLHADRHYPNLLGAIDGEPLVRLEGFGDGLTTVAMRQDQLSTSWLSAVLGFRLAQFATTGLIDNDLVHDLRLVHEPVVDDVGVATVHVVTLTETGRLVGYVALVGSDDPEPLALDDPDRARFPAEAAHDVDLLSELAAPGRTTHGAWEIKRFVKDRAMPHGPQRERVPWHLIAGLGEVILADPANRVILGDSGERGALRHLRLVGMDTSVVEGTRPTLPRTELMWPSYELPTDTRAKPFAGLVTSEARRAIDTIEEALRLPVAPGWRRRATRMLLANRGGAVGRTLLSRMGVHRSSPRRGGGAAA